MVARGASVPMFNPSTSKMFFSPQVYGGKEKPAYPKIVWCLPIQIDLEITLAELPGEITC